MQTSAESPCVATIGFFDGVHRGHQFLIDQVKRVAAERQLRTCLISFPIHPRKVLHADYQPALLSTCAEKERLLRATGVDSCVLLPFTQELSLLSAYAFMHDVLRERLHVQVLVIGYDHRFGHHRDESWEDYRRYGDELGMEVLHADACEWEGLRVSSSLIRSFLQKGEVEKANGCLGYRYSLEGTVVDGFKVGRTLGFPTANLAVDDADKLIPADGVYAARVYLGDSSYKGMLNIGLRPTLANGVERSIEVHILHFSGDIYHQTVRVEFLTRIREEKKFSGVEELAAQLARDAVRVDSLPDEAGEGGRP